MASANNYAYLLNDPEFAADSTDFSDPAALVRRQKRILEKIQKHKDQNVANFDPMRLLRSPLLVYTVILCHGGKFVLQVYEGEKMIINRTESKYVIRGK